MVSGVGGGGREAGNKTPPKQNPIVEGMNNKETEGPWGCYRTKLKSAVNERIHLRALTKTEGPLEIHNSKDGKSSKETMEDEEEVG